jgi:hypothetical protein
MANNFIDALGLTREYLRILSNNRIFNRLCYQGYSAGNFGNANPKENDTLNVRLPNRYKVVNGATYQAQYVQERTVPIVLNTRKHVPLSFSQTELTMQINDFSNLYLRPAAIQMAEELDYDGLGLYKSVYNQVGTPGVTPDTIDTYIDARTILTDNQAPPDGDWSVIVNPATEGALIKENTGLFNPQIDTSDRWRKGKIGNPVAGFQFYSDQNVRLHTTGNFGTGCQLKTPLTDNSNTIILDTFAGVTGNPGANEGDIFTIDGIYSVNPSNKQSTGRLQQFVVKTSTWDTTNTQLVLTVGPTPIASQTDAWQNITSLGVAAAPVTFSGTQNSMYPIYLAFAKDAFVFVSADLYVPNGYDMAAKESEDGLSLLFLRDMDISTTEIVSRMDILYGYGIPRPELACRILG